MIKRESVDKSFLCFRYERIDDIYSLSVFGHQLYQRIGDISCVDICGYNIYERVGNVGALFGFGFTFNGK